MHLKDDLRRRARQLRKQASPKALLQAEEHAIEWVKKQPGIVMVYVSIRKEVPTRRLLEELAGRIAIPRIEGKELVAVRLNDTKDLVPGGFSVPTVPGPAITVQHCLCPGLVFDEAGGRVGYGGGFYDRFLSRFPVPRVGLCLESAIIDEVPMLPHDHRMGGLITQRGFRVIHTR